VGELSADKLVGGQVVGGRVVGRQVVAFIVLGELSADELSADELSADKLPLHHFGTFWVTWGQFWQIETFFVLGVVKGTYFFGSKRKKKVDLTILLWRQSYDF
jgi:hypothetical protein